MNDKISSLQKSSSNFQESLKIILKGWGGYKKTQNSFVEKAKLILRNFEIFENFIIYKTHEKYSQKLAL